MLRQVRILVNSSALVIGTGKLRGATRHWFQFTAELFSLRQSPCSVFTLIWKQEHLPRAQRRYDLPLGSVFHLLHDLLRGVLRCSQLLVSNDLPGRRAYRELSLAAIRATNISETSFSTVTGSRSSEARIT